MEIAQFRCIGERSYAWSSYQVKYAETEYSRLHSVHIKETLNLGIIIVLCKKTPPITLRIHNNSFRRWQPSRQHSLRNAYNNAGLKNRRIKKLNLNPARRIWEKYILFLKTWRYYAFLHIVLFACLVKNIFSHIQRPSELTISPNLLCRQGLESMLIRQRLCRQSR